MNQPAEPPHEAFPEHNSSATSLRVLNSAELLEGAREVLIRHGAETYRLRITRQGKLILQK